MDDLRHIGLKELDTNHTSHIQFLSCMLYPLWSKARGMFYGILKEQLRQYSFATISTVLVYSCYFLFLFSVMGLEY